MQLSVELVCSACKQPLNLKNTQPVLVFTLGKLQITKSTKVKADIKADTKRVLCHICTEKMVGILEGK